MGKHIIFEAREEEIDEVVCSICGRHANINCLEDDEHFIYYTLYCSNCDVELDDEGYPKDSEDMIETYEDIWGISLE